MNKLKRWAVSRVAGTILVAGAIAVGIQAAEAQPVATAVGSSDVDCLGLAVYYEARSETDRGQRAVAQVVLNRVADPAYPDNVCGVVFQGFERRTGCQFSFTCDGSMARLPEGRAWVRAREIAKAALAGRGDASLGYATHYHTTAIYPYWAPSLRRVAAIGAHIFYSKPRSASAAPLSFARVEQVVLGASDGDPSSRRASVAVSVHRGGAARTR